MATIFSDSFNSYNDGDLNGQGSWSGGTNFDIQGATVYEGAKAVQGTASAGGATAIDKSGSLLSPGKTTFYIRNSSLTGCVYFRFFEGANLKFELGLVGCVWSGKIGYTSGGWKQYGNFAVNTWYEIEAEWTGTGTSSRFRMRVDGGTWTDWLVPSANWTTGLDKASLTLTTGTHTGYFDHIAENPYSPAVGTNMKINIVDVLKDVGAISVNIGDSWKSVTAARLNIGDLWKTIF